MLIGDLVRYKHKPIAQGLGVVAEDQGQIVKIVWSHSGGSSWEWTINLEVCNESR